MALFSGSEWGRSRVDRDALPLGGRLADAG